MCKTMFLILNAEICILKDMCNISALKQPEKSESSDTIKLISYISYNVIACGLINSVVIYASHVFTLYSSLFSTSTLSNTIFTIKKKNHSIFYMPYVQGIHYLKTLDLKIPHIMRKKQNN